MRSNCLKHYVLKTKSLFRMTESDIFLCLNGYSLKLAEEYLEIRGKGFPSRKGTIFYDPQRCNPANLSHIKYFSFANPFSRLLFLAFCFIRREVSFFFPHTSGGRLQQIAIRVVNNINFIEDGLDTYRDFPFNIDLCYIKDCTKYLCNHALASYRAPWVQQCNVIEIYSSLDVILPPQNNNLSLKNAAVTLLNVEHRLGQANRPINVLIESRGITEYAGFESIDIDFCLRHPNKLKSLKRFVPRLHSAYCNYDASIRLLQTPLDNVNFYVGETLLLFHLLKLAKANQSIHIYVCMSQSAIDNFSTMRKVIDSMVNVTIIGKSAW